MTSLSDSVTITDNVMTSTELSMCVIGHVDAGKSSLCGRLLLQTNAIDSRKMDKLQKEAEASGKGSFGLAFATDNNPEERKRGITINTTTKQFVTPGKGRKITMVDSPGHRDFINNMITGASQCNCAILVVSSVESEYIAGVAPEGQTLEHGLLVTALGVKNIIVAVNKMDKHPKEKRKDVFNNIVSEVGDRLKKIGAKNVSFVPISGYEGFNIDSTWEDAKSFYSGPCLTDLIDAFPNVTHDLTTPFRMAVSGALNVKGVGQIFTGKVYTGVCKVGMAVESEPSVRATATVKTIEKFHKPAQEAYPDDNIGISLKGLAPANAVLKKGDMIGAKGTGITKVKRFEGFFMVTQNPSKKKSDSGIEAGFKPVIASHTAKASSTIVEVKSIKARDSATKKDKEFIGERTYIKKNDKVTADFQPDKGMLVIEADKKFGILTRFVIRNSNSTMGLGQCRKILNEEYVENFMAPKKEAKKKGKEAGKKK